MIELKQKHVDAFVAKLPRDIPVNIVFYDMGRYASSIVRSAIAAKWVDETEDIGEWIPSRVKTLAEEIRDAYYKSLEVSPE